MKQSDADVVDEICEPGFKSPWGRQRKISINSLLHKS